MDTRTGSSRQSALRGALRTWRFLVGLTALAAPAAAAWANEQSASPSALSERIQLNGSAVPSSSALVRVTQSIGEPLATAGVMPLQNTLGGELAPSARQTMLWAEHPRSGLGVGIGVEQRRASYAAAGNPALAMQDRQPQLEGGMLMGVSLATSPRSHLVLQTPLMTPSASRALIADDPQFQQRQVRMGLVFNTKKPLADLRQGLRMELSGQTTLALKPRGGKIGFALQKIW